jgi:hypothetical protein
LESLGTFEPGKRELWLLEVFLGAFAKRPDPDDALDVDSNNPLLGFILELSPPESLAVVVSKKVTGVDPNDILATVSVKGFRCLLSGTSPEDLVVTASEAVPERPPERSHAGVGERNSFIASAF